MSWSRSILSDDSDNESNTLIEESSQSEAEDFDITEMMDSIDTSNDSIEIRNNKISEKPLIQNQHNILKINKKLKRNSTPINLRNLR